MRQGSMPARLAACGLLLALISSKSSADAAEESPLPDSRLGHQTAPLLLLSRPDVRADLGLTPEQAAAAQQAIREMYTRAAALRSKPNNEETIRGRRAIDEAMLQWIDERLSPEQKARLGQIDLQWEGPSALVSRTIIAETLRLSPEQIATIKTAIKRRDLARAAGQSDAERALFDASLACLNESQRETWRGLLGKPFVPQTSGREEKARK